MGLGTSDARTYNQQCNICARGQIQAAKDIFIIISHLHENEEIKGHRSYTNEN